ncbi:hypothetical protein O181_049981 [Austropuccinia psidii MF-1]|uniref:Integrase catalytic domain-containing protein n=1 Tax=Austropuccinia psidii MF-1 TaxID=1389203 RepID=A0A9Q3HLX3_9BASI|nr:hypothetical protein [Austropuccinia psidii MF-1]
MIWKIEHQRNLRVATVVYNNGTEFVNKDLKDLFITNGINHLTSSPYTPEKNTFSEQGNRTTINKTQCLLKDSGLEKLYWAEAENTSVFLENLTSKEEFNYETPMLKWPGRKPTLKYLYPFGCLAISIKNKKGGKYKETGDEGILLGYRKGHHTFRIMDKVTGNFRLTHHVNFVLEIFPGNLVKEELADNRTFNVVNDSKGQAGDKDDLEPTS